MSEGSNTSYADEVFEEDVVELFPPSPPPLSEAAIRRHLAALVREEARIRQQFINTVVLSARANWVAAHSALGSLQTRAVADAAAADAQQAALAGGYNDARNTQLIRPLDAIVYHGMETYAAPRSPTRRKGHPIAALQGLLSTTSEAEASCSTRMVDYGHPREVLRAVSDCASLCGEAAATNNDNNNNNDVSGSSEGLYDAASGDAFSNSVDSNNNNVANSGSTTSLTPFQRIKTRAAVQLHERLLKQLQSASKHENRRQNIELKALHQTLPVGMSHAARIIALQKLKSNERRVTHLGPLTRGPYSSPTPSQEPTPSSSLPSQHPPNTIVDTINSAALDKGHENGGSGVEDPDLEALPQHPKSTPASPSLAPSASHHSSSVSPAPRNRVTIAFSTSSGTHHQHKKAMPRGSDNNISNGMPTAKKTGRTPEEYLSPVHQAVLERYRRVRDETTETPTARLLNDPHYLFSTDAKKEMHDRTYLTATTAQKNKARAMKHEAIIAIKRYHDNHLRRQEAGLED